MTPDPLELLLAPFAWWRFAFVVVGLLMCALLWRDPRPGRAFSLLVALHVAAWASYVAPLRRLYALDEELDMSFNVGMAACVAAGGSPFEHTQTGFPSLEPLWLGLVATLALFRPENVVHVYAWMAPLAIVLVACGLYWGLRVTAEGDDAWERVLLVAAVLGLASFSLSQRSPLPPFWSGNFLLKPNHSLAFAVAGVVVGAVARGRRSLHVGLLLGLLAWVFILDWAFVCAGLILASFFVPEASARGARLRAVCLSIGLSGAIALPYVAHLMREHGPGRHGGTPDQVWRDPLAMQLALPHWATIDLGLLLFLGVAGVVVLWRRRAPRDQVVLGLVAAAYALWVAYCITGPQGFSPEPDEHHYFLRFAMAIAGGAALAEIARRLGPLTGLQIPRASVAVLAATIPLSFPAWFDPSTMDRYYRLSLPPLKPSAVEYAAWIRDNTPQDAIFAAGATAAIWIPALAGRHVLLTSDARPPHDYRARKEVERTLVLSRDTTAIQAAAAQYGISYLAIDSALINEYGGDAVKGLGRVPAYQWVYQNAGVRLLRIRKPAEAR